MIFINHPQQNIILTFESKFQVRSERNKAREEVRILRGRLEASQRETGMLRREKNDLEAQIAHISEAHVLQTRNDDVVDKPAELRNQVSFVFVLMIKIPRLMFKYS